MIPLASDLLIRFRSAYPFSGSAYPFPGPLIRLRVCLSVSGQMRREGPLEFASRQTGFLHWARTVIVSPIHRKCPAAILAAVDKIAERCK